jgi:peptidylprolyl isomerase
MKKVENGCFVDVYYQGRFPDGVIFDESTPKEPLSFKVGQGQVIDGFDKAVLGLKVGEKTTVTVDPINGYGEYDEDLLIVMPKDEFPEGAVIEAGMKFMLRSPEGMGQMATVVSIENADVTLDLNHTMAGKTLIFDIEVAAIKAK